MSKTKVNEFEGIEDVVNAAEEDKWQYPGLGWNANTGTLYFGDDKPDSVTGQVVYFRECKEVNTGTKKEPRWTRYHKFTKKDDMIIGIDTQQRVQAIMLIDGQLYNFGCKSWTSRALFVNSVDPKYQDKKYPVGLLHALNSKNAEIMEKHGKKTGLGSWTVTISKAKSPIVNEESGGEIFILDWNIDGFAGKELHKSNDAIIASEDLKGWAREWSTAGGAPVDDEAPPTVEDDINNIEEMPEPAPFNL